MAGWIGFDLDGTIISAAVAETASREWFAYYAEVLDDETITLHGGDNFLEPLLDIMERVTKEPAVTAQQKGKHLAEARKIYRTLFLQILATESVLNQDVVAFALRLKKQGYRLALISSSPVSLLREGLALLGLGGLFDMVIASPDTELSGKKELLSQFLTEHTLLCYVGDAEHDAAACRALQIPFILSEEVMSGSDKELMHRFLKKT